MQTTVYIRKENEERWLAIEDKSKWLNTLLEGLDSRKDPQPSSLKAAPARTQPKKDPLVKAIEDFTFEEEALEDDPFRNYEMDILIYSVDDKKVFNTETGEREDATPELVKELKRRKQTI